MLSFSRLQSFVAHFQKQVSSLFLLLARESREAELARRLLIGKLAMVRRRRLMAEVAKRAL